jgi:hypothetical protein
VKGGRRWTVGYKFVRHEWELTPEEQKKAAFILETNNKHNEAWSRDGVVVGAMSHCQVAAFEFFKGLFYSKVWRRLNIRGEASPFWGDDDDFSASAFNISEDGTKITAYRAEKEE